MKKDEIKSVLLLGVGGISMYQLALAYLDLGCEVYGYDLKKSKYTELCQERGVHITHRFNKEFLNVDLCVKSGAIKDTNKYVQMLKKMKCKIIDRAQALGEFCSQFKCVIAVAGTHGKSTTATLIYEILRAANKKVSCHIGADVFAPRFSLGDDFLVVEACEFNKSFLHLKPTISVVTNIEAEHMDCYESLFNLRTAFLTFLKRGIKRFVYLNKSTSFLKRTKNIEFVSNTLKNLHPKIKGEYNLKNISLAVAVTKFLGVDERLIEKVVNNFSGLPRRYEYKGMYNKIKVYIDYAHHPTELRSFISTFFLGNPDAYIVFQPHTYSRTKMFLDDFISVLKDVKNLCIYKEYSARERRADGLSAFELYERLKKFNPHVKYCASVKGVMKQIKNVNAVAFVGAGDINLVAQKIVERN